MLQLQLRGQDQSQGRERGSGCEQFRGGVGGVGTLGNCPHSPGSCACLCAVRLSVCPAGWAACLCVCCLCLSLGRSAGAPSPCGPHSVYAGAPKPALCPCASPCGFVCVVLGAVAVCLCLCGCAVVSVSLLHPHPLEVCPSVPLLVLWPRLSQGEGGLLCSSTSKLVFNCIFQLCASEGDPMGYVGAGELPQLG